MSSFGKCNLFLPFLSDLAVRVCTAILKNSVTVVILSFIFGTTINEDLHDEVIVTVIATGLDDSDNYRAAAPAKEAAPAPAEEAAPAPAASETIEEAPKHRAVFAADDADKFELDIPSFLRGRGTL